MVELLQPLIRRRRCAELGDRGPGEAGSRLFPKLTKALGRQLERRAARRIRVREHPEREPDDDRLDARLEQPHPGAYAEQEVREADPHSRAVQHERRRVERQRDDERRRVDRRRVEEHDHDQRDDVVDHGDRQQERPQSVGEPRADEREQPQCERGVG